MQCHAEPCKFLKMEERIHRRLTGLSGLLNEVGERRMMIQIRGRGQRDNAPKVVRCPHQGINPVIPYLNTILIFKDVLVDFVSFCIMHFA